MSQHKLLSPQINFNKHYTADVDAEKFENFKRQLNIIDAHNKDYAEGKTAYLMGINQFTDNGPDDYPFLIQKQ